MTDALSRRSLIARLASLAAGAVAVPAFAQDEVSEDELARLSLGRSVRVGTPSTGTSSIVPLEVYVSRVLAAESDPRALDAAREALAIAIRTYALVNENRHEREGYDVCDTVHCQVVRPSNPATRRLTRATALQVLLHDGRPAPLYYSASCGGFSERAEAVWPGVSQPYLQARPDDVHGEDAPWSYEVARVDAESALQKAGFVGQLAGVEIIDRTSSGRVATLGLPGMTPGLVAGNDFRLALGSTRVRSLAFTLLNDEQVLRFAGRGYGHGVGMCVIGAGRRAMRGASARQILEQYYPGLALVPLDAARGDRGIPRPQPFPTAF